MYVCINMKIFQDWFIGRFASPLSNMELKKLEQSVLKLIDNAPMVT